LATWQRQELLAILRPLAEVIPLRLDSNERAIERSKRKWAELEATFDRGYKPRIIVPEDFDDDRDLPRPKDSGELEQYHEERRKTEWQERAKQAIAEIRRLKRQITTPWLITSSTSLRSFHTESIRRTQSAPTHTSRPRARHCEHWLHSSKKSHPNQPIASAQTRVHSSFGARQRSR
jgi:hypothetical protein